MKVSPECFIQLSQRVKYCKRKRERYIIRVQGEKDRKTHMSQVQAKGQRKGYH